MQINDSGGLQRAAWAPLLALLAALGNCGGAAAATHDAVPELILTHGRIHTEDRIRPWAEAVAIGAGTVLAVGSNEDVLALRVKRTRLIDLGGRLVTPGLIDSHVHFADGAWYLRNVPLRDATTMAEVTRRVAQYVANHPRLDWVQGEGWSYGYADLPAGEFHKELLDRVSGTHPVFLDSSMAHAAWVNSEALRRAGITRATPNPPGGEIVRGADGEPTGWLKEDAAIRRVLDKIPAPRPADTEAALLGAIHEANRLGLTRVDSAGGDFAHLALLDQLRRQGRLTLRVSIADWVDPPGLTDEHLARLEAARTRHPGPLLSCCVAKFLMDGVIESHTAYLPGGYADKPAETGMRFFEPGAYKAAVRVLNQHGFQVYTHAIGDGAIRLALDAYAESQAALGVAAAASGTGAASPRNRIEHAEAPDAEDIVRFGTLGVVASMQPLMIYPRDEWQGMEGLWQQYAGARFLPNAFALRSLLDAHAVVAFGTDWPVVQLNPLLGIRNAVLRQSLDGQPAGGYVPAQRISLAEALHAYTLGAAYASRVDDQEGSIEVGKQADMVVFSRNFLELPPDALVGTRPVMTLVGGRIVFDGN